MLIWRPDLPEPRPAFKLDARDPEPVSLEALLHARRLCATFRVPPHQFRRRTSKSVMGGYYTATDIVAVNRAAADANGLGGDDGYYAVLLHELIHATGHRRRLGRPTTGDYSPEGYALEEGTALTSQRIVLREIGFELEALEWHAPSNHGLPVDQEAAEAAAAWILD